MSLTTLVAKATRRIHSHAVALHTKALRQRVKAATRNTNRAEQFHREADAVAKAARSEAQDAHIAFHRARLNEHNIQQAAQAEAELIGGQL